MPGCGIRTTNSLKSVICHPSTITSWTVIPYYKRDGIALLYYPIVIEPPTILTTNPIRQMVLLLRENIKVCSTFQDFILYFQINLYSRLLSVPIATNADSATDPSSMCIATPPEWTSCTEQSFTVTSGNHSWIVRSTKAVVCWILMVSQALQRDQSHHTKIRSPRNISPPVNGEPYRGVPAYSLFSTTSVDVHPVSMKDVKCVSCFLSSSAVMVKGPTWMYSVRSPSKANSCTTFVMINVPSKG